MASWRIVLYVGLAALAGSLFGFEISNISGAKEKFQDYFDLDSNGFKMGLVASSMTIGAMLGTVATGVLQDRMGRKPVLIIACTIYLVGAGLTCSATRFTQLIAGRIVTGVCAGLLCSTIPIYIAELAPASIRGRLVTLNQLFICTGVLLGYVADAAISSWRFVLGAGTPVAACLLVAFAVFVPRSPRWLLSRGRRAEAQAVLLQLRTPSKLTKLGSVQIDPRIATQEQTSIETEMETIEAAVRLQSHTSWRQLLEPSVARSVWIGIGLSIVQQLTGVNAINFYAQTVLQEAGFSSNSSNDLSILIGVVKVVMVLVAVVLMDRAGRKQLLIWGTAGMVVTVIVLASLLHQYPEPSMAVAWTCAFSLFFFMGFFEIGLGPVVWLLLSEIYPISVRGRAMAIGAFTNFFFTFIVGLMFPPVKDVISLAGIFFVFGGLGVVSIGWIWYAVPETKGRTLEEIQAKLSTSVRHGGFDDEIAEPLL